tara:strand:- start:9583 stop:10317 length:735 start_codon:yes stop_codon:yes gene_type:complete
MGWRYPKHDIQTGYAADNEALNENFHGVIDEVSGSIDEHNINTDIPVITRGQLAADAAFVLHRSAPSLVPNPTDYINQTHWSRGKISAAEGWQTYNVDGLKMKFEATGGTTWLCASAQITASEGKPSFFQKGFGYNVALMLDGVIIYDSLLGSGDTDTDFYMGYQQRGARLIPSSKNDLSVPQCGGGLSGAQLPVCVDAVVELSPGVHVLELAVMNIKGRMRQSASNSATFLTGYEMFALEMLR